MKLDELIEYLLDPEKLEGFYEEESVNNESEALLIYMEGALSLDAEIVFFGIEETEDDLVFEINGKKYFQLFPVDYAIELIESDLKLKNKGYTNTEIAQRLLDYRLRDA